MAATIATSPGETARYPEPPEMDPDDLLAIAYNMAEASHSLLACFGFMQATPNGHPFYAKLSETYDWLVDEGWRLLQETDASSVKGAAIKAEALGFDCTDETLRASLVADLERLATESKSS